MSKSWIGIRGNRFVDAEGRHVILRGLNLGGDSKVPYPDGGTHHPADFGDHDSVSFVGRPFPVQEADEHLGRIAGWGFNVLRLLVTWEAVEHAGPGQYDSDFIDHIRRVCEKAREHGLAVFVDFHQDVWSRMSGGSGAPGWIFARLGLDFRKFGAAGAAHVMQQRYDYADPAPRQVRYPQMSWPLNYFMPVNGIMWTAFFAGAQLTPRWTIDGRNVQDYLQEHYLGAVRALAARLGDLPNVIGFDSLNEPGMGWIGKPLSKPPRETGPDNSPARMVPGWTPLAGLMAARGLSVAVPMPGGAPALQVNTAREPIWLPGVADPFEQAGAWKLDGGAATALDEDFFCRSAQGPLHFERDCLGPFFARVAPAIRGVRPDWLLFAEINPHSILAGKTFPEMPPATVNASHWYDIDLLWSKHFPDRPDAAQTKAMLQRYRFQLGYLRSLGQRLGGGAPTLIGEFGVPYDLDGGASFRRWAEGEHGADVWHSQTLALGFTYDVLDEFLLSSTQWNYTASNRNDLRIGDGWNQEDLSVFSRDQQAGGHDGGRAVEGFCRPYVRRAQGTLLQLRYDAQARTLAIRIQADAAIPAPTEIYVPERLASDLEVECSAPAHWEHQPGKQQLLLHARADGMLECLVRFGREHRAT